MNFVFSLIKVLKIEQGINEKVITTYIMKYMLGHNSSTSLNFACLLKRKCASARSVEAVFVGEGEENGIRRKKRVEGEV